MLPAWVKPVVAIAPPVARTPLVLRTCAVLLRVRVLATTLSVLTDAVVWAVMAPLIFTSLVASLIPSVAAVATMEEALLSVP